jgi:methionyl-tRNA formyltransferase
MIKVVFMGTPDFAVPTLEKLQTLGQVVGVVTQPDRPAGRGNQLKPPPVKVAAEAAGIPIYQPKSLRKEEHIAPLREWQPDLIVVAAFGQILRPLVLNLPRLGCVNVHASLLPRWRGAAPIQHALLAGDEKTGVTLMQMDEGLDTGAMLVKAETPITASDTAQTLHDRLAQLGAQLLADHWTELITGRLTPLPQEENLSTYAPMIQKEDGLLNWSEPAAVLDRRLRAMTPWPGAYTFWNGELLKILSATPHKQTTAGLPGRVVELGSGVAVTTGEGVLQLHQIQLAGKKATSPADFLRGRPHFVGSVLGSFEEKTS